MKIATITQQPAEKFSYTLDYSEALTIGDNVKTATAVVVPEGLIVDNVGVYDPRVKFWISGGINGTSYKLTLTVNSEDGRVFQDEFVVKIKEL